jgi:hypothetical protein
MLDTEILPVRNTAVQAPTVQESDVESLEQVLERLEEVM